MQILVTINRPATQMISREYITDTTVSDFFLSDLEKLSNVMLNAAANSPKLYRRLAKIYNKTVDLGSLY